MTAIPDSEPIDRIPSDPEATAWRRAARRHQHLLREANQWPVGVHRSKDGERPVGSKIDTAFAETTRCNFLTDAAVAAVLHRLDRANRQSHETLNSARLWGDMLSSMPMCFNLFGPLWADPELATAATHRWFPDLVDPTDNVRVKFEWSPGRRDPRWLGDATAFDVAFEITGARGPRLIGIETKYHEYPIAAKRVIESTPPTKTPNLRYREVTEHAQLFRDTDWEQQIRSTRLEQVWRDHLLALACQQAEGGPVDVRYALVAPAANPVWARLADDYRAMLNPAAASTFAYRSVDALLAEAADVLPHGQAFAARYLDI